MKVQFTALPFVNPNAVYLVFESQLCDCKMKSYFDFIGAQMFHVKDVLKKLRKDPSKHLIIHYSSQSLFDEIENAYSPRITSIVVMFFENRQTTNFSLHSIAEELDIPRDDVEEHYDQIEKALLERFFSFAQNHFEKCWLHWNMRNTIFGFEHLEHRYRVLVKKEPPTIPFDNRAPL